MRFNSLKEIISLPHLSFKNGTFIIPNKPDKDLRTQCLKIFYEVGPVLIGTYRADFCITKRMGDTDFCIVEYPFTKEMINVIPMHGRHFNDEQAVFIGLFGRTNRAKDYEEKLYY